MSTRNINATPVAHRVSLGNRLSITPGPAHVGIQDEMGLDLRHVDLRARALQELTENVTVAVLRAPPMQGMIVLSITFKYMMKCCLRLEVDFRSLLHTVTKLDEAMNGEEVGAGHRTPHRRNSVHSSTRRSVGHRVSLVPVAPAGIDISLAQLISEREQLRVLQEGQSPASQGSRGSKTGKRRSLLTDPTRLNLTGDMSRTDRIGEYDEMLAPEEDFDFMETGSFLGDNGANENESGELDEHRYSGVMWTPEDENRRRSAGLASLTDGATPITEGRRSSAVPGSSRKVVMYDRVTRRLSRPSGVFEGRHGVSGFRKIDTSLTLSISTSSSDILGAYSLIVQGKVMQLLSDSSAGLSAKIGTLSTKKRRTNKAGGTPGPRTEPITVNASDEVNKATANFSAFDYDDGTGEFDDAGFGNADFNEGRESLTRNPDANWPKNRASAAVEFLKALTMGGSFETSLTGSFPRLSVYLRQ